MTSADGGTTWQREDLVYTGFAGISCADDISCSVVGTADPAKIVTNAYPYHQVIEAERERVQDEVDGLLAEIGCIAAQDPGAPDLEAGGLACQAVGTALKAAGEEAEKLQEEAECVAGQVEDPNPGAGDTACQTVGTALAAAYEEADKLIQELECAVGQVEEPDPGAGGPVCRTVGAVVEEAGCIAAQDLGDPDVEAGGPACQAAGTALKAVNEEAEKLKQEAECVAGQVEDPNPGAGDTACQTVGTVLESLSPPSIDPDPSDSCTDPTAVVADGHAGSAYVRLRVQQVGDDLVWVCFRANSPEAGFGGRLDVGGPVVEAPFVDGTSGACVDEGGNMVPGPHPMLSGEIGDPAEPATHVPYLIDAFADEDRAWFCLEVGGVERRVVVPVGGQAPPSVVMLTDSPDVDVPDPEPAPAGFPSAGCQEGEGVQGGSFDPVLNTNVGGGMHVWLESWQRSMGHARLCVRLQGPIVVGGALTVDASPSPGVEVVLEPGDDMAVCPVNILSNDQADVQIKRSPQGANPASVCVRHGQEVDTLTAGTEGELVPPVVLWEPDPDV